MTATSASAANAESRTTPASRCLPTPERKEKMEEVVSDSASANLAYHDPKRAPTLARIERLVGHPVDAEKLRAKLDAARAAVKVAPVRTLQSDGEASSLESPAPVLRSAPKDGALSVQTLGAETPSAGRVVNLRRETFEVYIGRPSPWGNPFVIGKDGSREEVLAQYARWLHDHPEVVARARVELKGKVLGCFCAPLPCHGDLLLRAANSTEPPTRDEGAFGLTEGPCPPSASPRSNLEGSSYYLVSVAGGPLSYVNRDSLKELHLRWDPAAREWSGVVLGSDLEGLRALGLQVLAKGPGAACLPASPRTRGPFAADIGTLEGLGLEVDVRQRRQPREPQGSTPSRRRDHAKASVEAYAGRTEGRESARLSVLDVTSGLPDDDREEDERSLALQEAQRKGRVAAARAVIQAHPGLEGVLETNPAKRAMFCAVHHVGPDDLRTCPGGADRSEDTSSRGTCAPVLRRVSCEAGPSVLPSAEEGAGDPTETEDVMDILTAPHDYMSEVRAREAAVLPGSDYDDG